MKRIRMIVTVILCTCILFLVGCGTTNSNGSGDAQTSEQFADQEFITSLANGLEARWKLNDEYENKYQNADSQPAIGSDEHVESYTSWVNAELDEIADYKDAKFEDSKLKEKAISYINCLNDQLESLEYATLDVEKYYELWQNAYKERSKLIEDFVNDYGLTVSEQYQSTLKEMLTNSKLVKENEDEQQKVNDLAASIEFEIEKSDDDWKTCSAIVENTTGMNIKTLDFTINLLDEDGVILETTYDSIGNIQNGQKARIEFITDKNFTSTKVTVNYWEKQ